MTAEDEVHLAAIAKVRSELAILIDNTIRVGELVGGLTRAGAQVVSPTTSVTLHALGHQAGDGIDTTVKALRAMDRLLEAVADRTRGG